MIYFNIFHYHLVILWLYEPLRAMDCHDVWCRMWWTVARRQRFIRRCMRRPGEIYRNPWVYQGHPDLQILVAFHGVSRFVFLFHGRVVESMCQSCKPCWIFDSVTLVHRIHVRLVHSSGRRGRPDSPALLVPGLL